MDQNFEPQNNQNKEELTENLFKEVPPEMASMQEKVVTTEPVLNFDFSSYTAPTKTEPVPTTVMQQKPVVETSQPFVPSYEVPKMEPVNQPIVNQTTEVAAPTSNSDILFDNTPVVNQTQNYNNPIPNMVDSIEPKETAEVVEKVEEKQPKKSSSDKSGMIFIGILFGFLILFVLFLQPISDFIAKITG